MVNNSILLIPTYQPELILLEIIEKMSLSFSNVIVVNDGSDRNLNFFDTIQQQFKVTLLHHETNLGKGAALKTGFDYILNQFPLASHVVMCDSDGQHSPEDVLKVALKAEESPSSVIFGTRSFDKKKVPFRSYFGNILTQKIINIFFNIPINDTQTGLRAYPLAYLQDFINISYNRYEYDMESILLIAKKKWDLKCIPIQTIYIEENKGSHFNPFIDSLKIYLAILKYGIISVLSFFIDFILFSIMTILNFSTFSSLSVSKSLSAIFNFTAHHYWTFNASKNLLRNLSYYILLWVSNLFISLWFIEYIISISHYNKITVKVMADIVLFIVNFTISKYAIFKRS